MVACLRQAGGGDRRTRGISAVEIGTAVSLHSLRDSWQPPCCRGYWTGVLPQRGRRPFKAHPPRVLHPARARLCRVLWLRAPPTAPSGSIAFGGFLSSRLASLASPPSFGPQKRDGCGQQVRKVVRSPFVEVAFPLIWIAGEPHARFELKCRLPLLLSSTLSGLSRSAERLGACRGSRAIGTIMRALTRELGSSFASAIWSRSAKRSSESVTILGEPSAGKLGGEN
jgi:hypothetical protein